ncbi:MAG TPA: flavodoxin family protein [Candidatus Ratteibacteria bacterium]|nr:flavodoxin family protein [bacterium]HRR95851.1 flavodoxin family protein [Candidatus Ratteibacteria bacterium]
MYVLGICGSPRRHGNSELLLDMFLKHVEKEEIKTKKFILNQMRFVACQECENVRNDGRCKIEDDMQKIYPEVENADVIVVASPIFFGSLSAQTKMMIDRFQCQYLAINFFKTYKPKNKKGYFICVEASERNDFIENAKSIIKNFFVTIGAKYSGEIICKGVDKKSEVKEKKECLEKVKEISISLITR